MEDVKELMREHYLRYASYVILDRAIPHIADGLKPVQRRILYTLSRMHNGKFHKVANVVGQTMAYHPHGDAPIYEALIALAQKGYVLDQQGNFGNVLTGDPAAASRYIEARLSPLALETLFQRDLMTFVPSYDGRAEEPTFLPAKIPLLLMQGAEGIAVGMTTKIFPHNFVELLRAEIALLRGTYLPLVPDFPTGGIMDAGEYDDGRGKIRLRAKIEIRDPKTLIIREICYGTTTESLIQSIDDAAKKGRIKIDSISDYTAAHVEIEILLPRGQYAQEVIEQLYAYTECQVSLSPQMVLIQDNTPKEMPVREILEYNVHALELGFQCALEIEAREKQESIFAKELEQIFIENRLYTEIEEVAEQEAVYAVLEEALSPFFHLLSRTPEKADYDTLLAIPIRRIARFDREHHQQEIKKLHKHLETIRKNLKNLREYCIDYLESLVQRFGDQFPRKTFCQAIEVVDRRAIETKEVTIGFDPKTGYFGTKVVGSRQFQGTNFDKVLVLYKSGAYKVVSLSEKQYVGQEKDEVVHIGIADKSTIFVVIYRDKKSGFAYAKKFIVKQFILGKVYEFLEKDQELLFFTTRPEAKLLLQLMPKPRQRQTLIELDLATFLVKGVTAHGVRVTGRHVMKVTEKK